MCFSECQHSSLTNHSKSISATEPNTYECICSYLKQAIAFISQTLYGLEKVVHYALSSVLDLVNCCVGLTQSLSYLEWVTNLCSSDYFFFNDSYLNNEEEEEEKNNYLTLVLSEACLSYWSRYKDRSCTFFISHQNPVIKVAWMDRRR